MDDKRVDKPVAICDIPLIDTTGFGHNVLSLNES